MDRNYRMSIIAGSIEFDNDKLDSDIAAAIIHEDEEESDDSMSSKEENQISRVKTPPPPISPPSTTTAATMNKNDKAIAEDDYSLGEEEEEEDMEQEKLSRRTSRNNKNKNGVAYQSKQERALRSLGVPEDYIADPLNAEPVLENLQRMVESNQKNQQQQQNSTLDLENNDVMANRIPLEDLLEAAERDIDLHRRRVRAVLTQNVSILASNDVIDLDSNDPHVIARKERQEALLHLREELSREASSIISDFTSEDRLDGYNLTINDLVNDRLERFKGALELFVHHNFENNPTDSTIHISETSNLDCLTLIESLCRGWRRQKNSNSNSNVAASSVGENNLLLSTEEEGHLLQHASHICQSMLEQTAQNVRDAKEEAAETEDAYHVQLEAHSIAAKQLVQVARNIEDSYMLHGKEALRIGHSLEMAERQRRSCESASILLKRWWMMEQLAEQEEASGPEIQVQEEVRGVIPSSSCRMDPLYTRPENSLDAAKALLDLRNVLSSRSNTNDPTNSNNNKRIATTPSKRFEMVGNLVRRTSYALEARLINQFSEIYSGGGTYDFSSVESCSRPGRLNWIHLRDLAEALLCFDNGKSLYQRYVSLVVTTKFPELFHSQKDRQMLPSTQDESNDDSKLDGETNGKVDSKSQSKQSQEFEPEDDMRQKDDEFDIDTTRSQLSSLFHRVCSVCTAEFQLMAHVFSIGEQSWSDSVYPVARALLQRIISDPVSGLQGRINDLLSSIDGNGGSRVTNGAKKLDTFVVIHEKAAGLFSLLKEAAEGMLEHSQALEQLRPTVSTPHDGNIDSENIDEETDYSGQNSQRKNGQGGYQPAANARAVQSLIQFLSAQEIALGNGHRRGYLNLELRLLHHDCCSCLEQTGVQLILPNGTNGKNHNSNKASNPTTTMSDMAEYRAPTLQMDKDSLRQLGFNGILEGPLRSNILRQPLIQSTDSLARARLMFGGASMATSSFSMAGQTDTAGNSDDDPTAKVVWAIYSQVCNFYGDTYLYPLIETLGNMLQPKAPSSPPILFTNDGDLTREVHDLGVPSHFWKCLDHIHLAARSFDKELWAYHRQGSGRVWEILTQTGSGATLSLASNRRLQFFSQLEELGEVALLQALNTLSTHIQWMLVMGGEYSVRKEGTTGRLLHGLTGPGSGGPYAIPASSSLNPNCSPAVDSLQRCLREQFVYINVALTPQSLTRFWTALSMRLYDILVTRLLQHYTVSLNGAVILNKDVEALQYAASLAGTDHSHWGRLRELLSVFMTPPDALKTILVGAEGDINSGKGLFATIGRDESLVFMSRRADFKYKTNQGLKKSVWVTDLLHDLAVADPTDSPINIARYAAERKHQK